MPRCGLWILALICLGLVLSPAGCARWGFDPPVDAGLDGNGSDDDADGSAVDGADLDGADVDGADTGGADADGADAGGGGPGDRCAVDADCGQGLVCAGGWCLQPCERDADCATGRCDEGLCTDAPADECRRIIRLRDDFEDEQVGELWEPWTSGGAVLGEAGGQLALSPSALGPSGAGLRSRRLYDLSAGQVTIELATMVNTGQDVIFGFFLDHPLGSDDRLVFKQEAGTLSAFWVRTGSASPALQAPWDAAVHRFLRIREQAGEVIWEASGDGRTFQELTRDAAPFPVRDLRLNLQVDTIGPTSAPGAVRIAQVNGTHLPASTGALEVCEASSIQDDFDDGWLRPVWYYSWAQPGTDYQEAGGRAVLTPASDQTGYAGLLTGEPFDLREDAVWVSVIEATGDDPSADTEFGVMSAGGANLVKFSKTGTELGFWTAVAGAQSAYGSLTYDPVAHRHWRLRQAAGFIHWETSADKLSWTEQAQAVPPFDLGQVQLFMQAGTYNMVSDPGRAVFDDFDIP